MTFWTCFVCIKSPVGSNTSGMKNVKRGTGNTQPPAFPSTWTEAPNTVTSTDASTTTPKIRYNIFAQTLHTEWAVRLWHVYLLAPLSLRYRGQSISWHSLLDERQARVNKTKLAKLLSNVLLDFQLTGIARNSSNRFPRSFYFFESWKR